MYRLDYRLIHSKDRFKQRIVLKFLFLKGLRYEAAHIELSSVLGEQACSLSQAKRWIRRVKDGDLHARTMIGPGDRSRILWMEFNPDHFLAAIEPELSKENSNSKGRVDRKELIVHMDNSMCHNERKIQDYFARKMMRTLPSSLLPRSVIL
jgi:hypothetical protein